MKKETVDNNNIDETEIKKFNQLASKWWDLNGEFKSLHKINPLRSNWIDSHTNVAEKQLLDVGCGGGLLCEPLSRLGANVTGIDAAKTNIEVAKIHMEQSGLDINYLNKKPEDIENKLYDVVLCMEIIEHVMLTTQIINMMIIINLIF